MTLQQRVSLFITAVGADVKALYSRAVPSGGTTGQFLRKSSGVDYATEWATPSATGATIDDATPAADKVYSSNKTNSVVATAKAEAIAQAKSDIIGGASAAYDTLVELQAFIQNDQTAISGLVTAVGTRVDTASAQTFTAPQKAQARTNIDAYGSVELGNPDTDLVALYTTAKA